jgi:polysaccharide export outer membrane protein
MSKYFNPQLMGLIWAVVAISTLTTGCATTHHGVDVADSQVPRELEKVTLPPYVIEPPDELLVDALRVIPQPPYRIEPLDAVVISVTETLPNEPIGGINVVDPDGSVNLGPAYGSVRLAGFTLEQARAEIEKYLKTNFLKGNPKVTVALAQSRALQQIRGEHLVRPDGTISLGNYGEVQVAGLTIPQAKKAIEEQLIKFLYLPEVSVDILGFNSKVYYVIFNLSGAGLQVYRQPITGNETVLDALGGIGGIPPIASKDRVWVARPSPAYQGCDQVLPVDLNAIAECGSTATNYQLLPNDRLYVQADPWIHVDNTLAKVLMPFERIFGVTLLGNAAVHGVSIRLGTTSGGGTGGGVGGTGGLGF